MAETTLHVLLVEDDEDDYLLVRDYLGEADGAPFALEWASTYEAGVHALARQAHDVALIDYRLGARSGLDLLLSARAAGDLPPAIVLTGVGDQAIDAAAQAAGAADFLIKGRLDAAGLERAIRYTLDHARQRAALAGAQDFLQATLDALSAHIAVLNECGTIVAVNAAWRRFAGENDFPDAGWGLGLNYLAVCDAAAATGEAGAEEVAVAIRDLLAGQGESFTQKYPCHSPDERRWFEIRATRFVGDGPPRVAVAHENVTARHLAEERIRFQAQVLDQVSAAVIATDQAGAVTHWNAHATALYGWAAVEVLGRPVTALMIGPADLGTGRAIMARVAAGEVWTGEFPLQRKDGTSFPAYVTNSAIHDERGQPAGVVGVSVDISERKAAEAALIASEARYRMLLEQASDGIVVMDPEGRFLEVNAQACTMLGYAREELLGLSSPDVIAPADLVERPLVVPSPGTNRLVFERRLRRRDGTTFPVEVSLKRLPDGRTQAIMRDITERWAAAAALHAQHTFTAAIASSLGEGVYALDTAGRLTFMNPTAERLLGWTQAQLLGQDIHAAIHARHADGAPFLREDCPLLGVLRTGEPYRADEDAFARRDGTILPVTYTSAPILIDGRVTGAVLAFRDITERKAAEAARRASEASLAEAQRIAHVGSWEYDHATGALRWSDEFFRIAGFAPQSFIPTIEQNLALIHPEDRAHVIELFRAGANHGPATEVEFRLLRPDGEVRFIRQRAESLADATGQSLRRLGVVHDVTEQRSLEQQLRHQAFHDPLTGLPNRALFLDRLGQALARARRDGRPCAVLFLDLDRFKDVNDTLGHDAGDRLLVAVAARLGDGLRDGDTLARLGGDEFTVLLGGAADASAAAHAATRLLDALGTPLALDGREYRLTASVGIATGRADHTRPEEVLRDADIALYRAKEAGRAGYAVFDPMMQAQIVARLDFERDLRLALERSEFALHYQPIIDLRTGRAARVEALVRWHHPARGLVPPGEFITLAEETGLIVPLGRWVLAEACRQAAAWAAAGTPVAVAVNLTAREFQRPGLADEVAAALAAAGLAARWLGLEITESLAMRDAAATVITLRALRAFGVRVAIDDFGTGYSSLAYLKRLPVDALKIDKAFVDGLGADEGDTAIVAVIVALAHTLGLRVVAEGVETAAQADRLRALGCDAAQGYHFARPLPAAALSPELLQFGAVSGGLPTLGVRRAPTTGALRRRREARSWRLLPTDGGTGQD